MRLDMTAPTEDPQRITENLDTNLGLNLGDSIISQRSQFDSRSIPLIRKGWTKYT